jgi:hypothetical protein
MRNRKSLWGLLIILGTILLFSNNGESLTITSASFKYYANIPKEQACPYYGGDSSNPQLSLSIIPSSTKAFALIMDDPDAPGGTYLHWLIYWNSPNITSMNESSLPSGAVQGVNDNSTMTYFGPCPPSNHRYYFRVYALDTTLSLSMGFTRNQLESAMNGHILESNFLMGWFPSGGSSCTYTLSPQSYGYSSAASTGNIAVTCSSSNCTWTAASNYSWLTITSGSSGTGSGTVAYSVAANNSAARTGTISIAGQTATVTQASTPTPTPPTPDIKANGQDGQVTVANGTKVSITASLAPGNENGKIADWWLAYSSPAGWYSLNSNGWTPGINLLVQYPLFSISAVEIYSASLSVGDYAFYFLVDMSPNGIVDSPFYYDFVQVHVVK